MSACACAWAAPVALAQPSTTGRNAADQRPTPLRPRRPASVAAVAVAVSPLGAGARRPLSALGRWRAGHLLQQLAHPASSSMGPTRRAQLPPCCASDAGSGGSSSSSGGSSEAATSSGPPSKSGNSGSSGSGSSSSGGDPPPDRRSQNQRSKSGELPGFPPDQTSQFLESSNAHTRLRTMLVTCPGKCSVS